MFASVYFASSYFGPEYFAEVGGVSTIAAFFKDLTTILVRFLPTMRAVVPFPETSTLLSAQLATWRAADTSLIRDMNTIIARALS